MWISVAKWKKGIFTVQANALRKYWQMDTGSNT